MFFKEFTNFVIFNVMCFNLSHKVVGLSSLSNWPFFKCIAMVVHIYICMKVLFFHLLTLELDIVFLNNYFTRYLNDIHGVAIVHSIVVLICASHDGRI